MLLGSFACNSLNYEIMSSIKSVSGSYGVIEYTTALVCRSPWKKKFE